MPLYGKTYRAVVVHSSKQDQRRHKRLEREIQAASTTLATTVRAAAKPEYFCRADAEAAAKQLRALQSAYHRVEVMVEEHPSMGPDGRAQSAPRDQSAAVWPAGHTARAGEGHCPQAARGGLFCAADECPDGRGDDA